MLGVNLHIINVSRISPLELEGVQMPDKEHANLNFLTATYWTRLRMGTSSCWTSSFEDSPRSTTDSSSS